MYLQNKNLLWPVASFQLLYVKRFFILILLIAASSESWAFRPKIFNSKHNTDCDRYAFDLGCWAIGGSLTFQERGAGAGIFAGYYLFPQTSLTMNADVIGYSNAINQPGSSVQNAATTMVRYGPGLNVAIPVLDDVHIMPFINFLNANYSGQETGRRFMVVPGLNLVYAISNIVFGVNFSYWLTNELPVGENLAFSPVFSWHF